MKPAEEKEDLELEGLSTMSDTEVSKALVPEVKKVAKHNTH